MKGVLWKVAKRLSYIEDARCLKVNSLFYFPHCCWWPVIADKNDTLTSSQNYICSCTEL